MEPTTHKYMMNSVTFWLRFCKDDKRVVVSLALIFSDGESAKIRDIEAWDLKFGDQSTPTDAELVDSGSLSLLSVAVPYSIADAVVDLSFQPQHMTEDMTAFGLRGKSRDTTLQSMMNAKISHQGF